VLPWTITWKGGAAKAFDNITDVKVMRANGDVVGQFPVCRTYEAPYDTDSGVIFQVLPDLPAAIAGIPT
jgi:hypothetical protein